MEQGDIGGPVRVVFDAGNLCRNTQLVAPEIDTSVGTPVSAPAAAGGNAALIVTPTAFLIWLQK